MCSVIIMEPSYDVTPQGRPTELEVSAKRYGELETAEVIPGTEVLLAAHALTQSFSHSACAVIAHNEEESHTITVHVHIKPFSLCSHLHTQTLDKAITLCSLSLQMWTSH